MRLGRGGAIVVAAVALAGCGGPSHAQQRRNAVNTYFDRVDRAEQSLLASTATIDAAFRAFTLSTVKPSEQRALARAQTKIGQALKRVRAIDPPPEARHIHTDLVDMLRLQYETAHDLAWTARYEPRFAHALTPLPAASSRLARDISRAGQSTQSKLAPAGDPGAALWKQEGCGTCHTFAATGSSGSTGSNLDQLHPSAAVVAAQVRNGGPGMPAFQSKLSAAEITTLASFVASYESPVPSTAAVLNAYGAAFSHFGTTLGQVLAKLEALSAPPELRPSLVTERRTLERGATLCKQIATALAKQKVKNANALIRQLFGTMSRAGSAKTASDQAAAVKAYNTRLTRIKTLAAKVTRERQRLVRTIG